MTLRRHKQCQYGVFGQLCRDVAVTRRKRPNMSEMWDVCDHHAAALDRIHDLRENSRVLERLTQM